jgi:hypothetical protein
LDCADGAAGETGRARLRFLRIGDTPRFFEFVRSRVAWRAKLRLLLVRSVWRGAEVDCFDRPYSGAAHVHRKTLAQFS